MLSTVMIRLFVIFLVTMAEIGCVLGLLKWLPGALNHHETGVNWEAFGVYLVLYAFVQLNIAKRQLPPLEKP